MARGTAKFAHQIADQERVADLQQVLLAQCELVIRQTETCSRPEQDTFSELAQ
jgi:hypothetical protein